MKPNEDDELDFLEEDKKPVAIIVSLVIMVVLLIVVFAAIWMIIRNRGNNNLTANNQFSLEDTQETSDEILYVPETQNLTTESQASEVNNEINNSTDNKVDGGAAANMQNGDESGLNEKSPVEGVSMSFQDMSDTVTAKDKTNLRSEPSTAKEDSVVVQIKNGETVARTGVNDETGWSRVEYQGQVLYAVSRYLTTDVTPKAENPPETATDNNAAPQTSGNTVVTKDGRTITFTSCDDTVSPKMEVNLRGEPSQAQGNDTIHVRLMYGETAHRTGYDEDSGWSRVEYNGEVLYAVTSYLFVVEETTE